MSAVTALIRQLQEGDPSVRAAAARELGNLGPAAAPAAEALAGSLADPALRSGAAWALVKIGAAAAPAVIRMLEHPDAGTRLAAVGALWKVSGEAGPAALAALEGALEDPDVGVRAYTARAVGEVGRRAAPLAQALAEGLDDGAPEVRRAAAEALGRLGEVDEGVAQGLAGALGDRDGEVRLSAAHSLQALAGTRSGCLRRALAALDHLARTAERRERASYREAAAAIRAHVGAAGAGRDNLPRPAAPHPDLSNLPIISDPGTDPDP